MAKVPTKGAQDARNQLPSLLEAAERGHATIITKHGKAVAALVPIKDYTSASRQIPLIELRGSGRGLWGKDSRLTIAALRDEWER